MEMEMYGILFKNVKCQGKRIYRLMDIYYGHIWPFYAHIWIYGFMDIYGHFMKMDIIENLPYMGMESSDPIYGPYMDLQAWIEQESVFPVDLLEMLLTF